MSDGCQPPAVAANWLVCTRVEQRAPHTGNLSKSSSQVSSLTMRTTALMVVISYSSWACLPAEQHQQEQLPLRMDASRDTTPHL